MRVSSAKSSRLGFASAMGLIAFLWSLAPLGRIGDAYGELRIVSRNSLVFVDSVQEGGEWAAYRLVDATHPVVFKAAGPGRIVFRLRSVVAADAKPAVAAILNDDRIVLTARVEPARDAGAKLVEGKDKGVSKPRVYVVRLASGEHTVIIRYSEGDPLLVAATHIEGADPGEVAAESEDAPLVGPAPTGPQNRVQRIGEVPIGDSDEVSGEIEEPVAEELAETSTKSARRAADDEAWANVRSKRKGPADKLDDLSGRTGPEFGDHEPDSGDPFRPRKFEPLTARALTVHAPWLVYEVHGGLMVSRLGLDPGAVLGMDVRVPIPGLDARRFTLGVSLDGAYARGSSAIIGETSRVAIGIARVRHMSLSLAADARLAFRRIEDVFEPYAGAGGGILVGSMAADDGTTKNEGSTFGGLGIVRIGAAFGAPSRERDAGTTASRPFFEVRISGGALSSELTRDSTGGGSAGYVQLDAVVGYRLELLTEARAE